MSACPGQVILSFYLGKYEVNKKPGKGNTAVLTGKKEPTLEKIVELYRLVNLADGKSLKTVQWYNDMLRQFLSYVKQEYQSLDLSCFNITTVRNYILYLKSKVKFEGHPYTPKQDTLLSPKTVQCHVRVLKAFSSSLHNEGYTDSNILEKLKLPKAPATMVEPLSKAEKQAVLHAINKKTPTGIRNNAIVELAFDSGLRASEITDIRVGHLNMDEGWIKVMGKGSKERIVPIGKVVQRKLWHYIEHVRPQPANNSCNNLFLTTTGHPIKVNTIKLIFSRLAKASGVSRLHAHICRHTFAVDYLMDDGDIFSLQRILGHTTLDMVEHYLNLSSSQITAQHHKHSPMDKFYGK